MTKRLLCLMFPVAMGMSASLAEGQTQFLFRDTLPDLSRYQTVDDCLAVVSRLQRKADLARPFWVDTMVSTRTDALEQMPPNIVATVRECISKFRPDSVDVSEYSEWMTLYLIAGRDSDAEILINRRLSQVSQDANDTVNSRSAILMDLFKVYGQARPIRVQRLRELVDQIVASDSASWKTMFRAYTMHFGIAKQIHDTATLEETGRKILEISKKLTNEEAASPFYVNYGRGFVMGVLQYIDRLALLDSLRASSTAYVALRTKHWEQARGPRDELPKFLGKQAPALTGDFWFTPPPQSVIRNVRDEIPVSATPIAAVAPMTRPASGKVSLVVFLYGGCREEVGVFIKNLSRPTYKSSCWGAYSAIRRLVEKYPALEVTIVSQTTGYVAETQPLSPEQEAQMLRSWWLDFHRLPATLVISNPTYFRLSQPDGRRIDDPMLNAIGYLFGTKGLMGSTEAYLIDVNGMILHSGGLNPNGEREVQELLEVVMNRPR